MTIVKFVAFTIVSSMLSTIALAQNAEVHFWLKGSLNNIVGCMAADPSFTREHTFLLADGKAEIKSAGGINVGLKLARPAVYTGDFDLGRMNLNIVADLSAAPKTLTVTNQDSSCKWSAVKE